MKAQKKLPDFVNGFKVLEDLGNIKGLRYALFECEVCKNPFKSQITNARHRKRRDCGCVREIKNYDVVNDYKIIRDDGRIGRKRPGRAICKACGNEFECNIYALPYLKGCGCINPCPPPPLDKVINGFRVIKDLGVVKGKRKVVSVCKMCGNEFEAQVGNLQVAKGCSCFRKKIPCSYKQIQPRLYRIYKNMHARCYDARHKSYHNYGARGITVCDEWINSPDVFCEWALNNGYKDDLSIDRIDVNGNYCAENCRWTTVLEQHRNTRSNVLTMDIARAIREDRKTMKQEDIADKYNIARTTVSSVVNNYIWKE